MYSCNIVYGIVKIEKYSCNKGEYLYLLVTVFLLNKKEPEDKLVYCSAPNKHNLNNICDTVPLDNASSISVPALSYITLNIDDCKINEISWSNWIPMSNLLMIVCFQVSQKGSVFQPNPNGKHPQPILQDDTNVPQEARDCLNAMLKNNFQSIVSKLSADIGKTKLLKMDITIKGPPITCRLYLILLKYQKFVDEEIKLLEAIGCISKSLSPWPAPMIIIPEKYYPN